MMGMMPPATKCLQMLMRQVVFPIPGSPAIIKCGLLAMEGDHVTVWPPRAMPRVTTGTPGCGAPPVTSEAVAAPSVGVGAGSGGGATGEGVELASGLSVSGETSDVGASGRGGAASGGT